MSGKTRLAQTQARIGRSGTVAQWGRPAYIPEGKSVTEKDFNDFFDDTELEVRAHALILAGLSPREALRRAKEERKNGSRTHEAVEAGRAARS